MCALIDSRRSDDRPCRRGTHCLLVVLIEVAPDAAKVFRAERFVRGYQQLWINPEDAQIITFVYQFASQVGARQDYARATKGYEAKPPRGLRAKKFALTDLPTGQSLGIAQSDKTGAAERLQGLQDRATAIAEDQLRRLSP